ncbi:hypothetical protein [Streptomyces sp. ALI-76-A]|uniref:hypothetical protein n=1 Tax=Streptomyces sp. ALI-76-A TaxID=3025736 RepID=UPI00256F36BB|nr:hypothetical protein [Streptomyces sp. ALI-76-A]MDL5205355.1 hypothetical protein [Streptomyces sp. ALI-76-A]
MQAAVCFSDAAPALSFKFSTGDEALSAEASAATGRQRPPLHRLLGAAHEPPRRKPQDFFHAKACGTRYGTADRGHGAFLRELPTRGRDLLLCQRLRLLLVALFAMRG